MLPETKGGLGMGAGSKQRLQQRNEEQVSIISDDLALFPSCLSFLSSKGQVQRAQCLHLNFCHGHESSKDGFGSAIKHLDADFHWSWS